MKPMRHNQLDTQLFHLYMLTRLWPNHLRNFPAKLTQNVFCNVIFSKVSGVCLRYELIIPWVNATVHHIYRRKGEAIVRQWPLVQHLISFCSCCRSAVKLRRMTAPECSSGTCTFFWNSAPLCHVRGGKGRKKLSVNTLLKYGAG